MVESEVEVVLRAGNGKKPSARTASSALFEERNPYAPPTTDAGKTDEPLQALLRLKRLARAQRLFLQGFALMVALPLPTFGLMGAAMAAPGGLIQACAVGIAAVSAAAWIGGSCLQVYATFAWVRVYYGTLGVLSFMPLYVVGGGFIAVPIMYVGTTRELKAAGFKPGFFGVTERRFYEPRPNAR